MIAAALLAAHQVILMLLLIGVGMVCARRGWIGETAARALSQLLYCVTPALLIHAFEQPYEPEPARGLLLAGALAILFHSLAAIIAQLLLRTDEARENAVARMGAVYSNCGFMAFPLIGAVLGERGVFYGSAFVGIFNLFLWTHGRALLLGRKQIRLKQVLLAPGVFGTAAGALLYFCRIPLPGILSDFCASLASLNTPLAMIVIGVFLAACSPRSLANRRVLLPAFCRMALLPLVFFLLLLPLCGMMKSEESAVVCTAVLLCAACPAATSTVLMTSSLGFDSVYGSRIVFLTSLLSVLTIPLFNMLAYRFF